MSFYFGQLQDKQAVLEYKQQRIDQFSNAFKKMIATSEDAFQKTNNKTTKRRARDFTREDINTIVREGTPVERAALSQYFFETNGLYKRIILHYATFLTYSWVIVPYLKRKNDKITNKKIADAYYSSTDFCTNFQIERKCAIFAKEVLVKGAYYGLVIDVGQNDLVIQDLPFEYCRSRFKDRNDIDIIEFDLDFFKKIRDEKLREEIVKTYPRFIQKAYKKYIANKGERWIYIPAEMGIYFSYFEERPLFLDLIPLLDDLDDYKDIDKKRKMLALKKILVQQVKTDGLNLVFEPDEAEAMHEGAVDMLRNNTDLDVLTTYNNVNLLDLNSSDDETTDVQQVQDLIYESAGLSKEFFFSTTEAGLKYSTYNDLAMMMVLGQRFSHFFTQLLNFKFENSKVRFKFIIIPLSYYNAEDYTSRAREMASFGYSFITPILSTGIDQTSLANLKMLENDLLELDIILKPLQSSYTQSGKAAGEPMGDTQGSSKSLDKTNDNQNDTGQSSSDTNSNQSKGGEKE